MSITFSVKPKTYKLVCGVINKYLKNPAPGEAINSEISLCCARNTSEAVVALIECDEAYSLSVGKSECFTYLPGILNLRVEADFPLDVKLNIIGKVKDDDYCEKGDILLDCDSEMSDIHGKSAVWCELMVPSDCDCGEYVGKIRLYSHRDFDDEELCGELNVKLRVYSYVLPDRKDSKFHLDLWQHCSVIASRYGVKRWRDEHFEILEEYVKSLSALSQKAVTLVVSEMPWNGQFCRAERRFLSSPFEYSIIGITKRADGSFEYDFSAADRYVELCEKYGICDEISIYGLVGIWGSEKPCSDCYDNLRVRYLDEKSGTYKYMRCSGEIDSYIKAIESHFVQNGKIEKVRVAADEPVDKAAFRAALAHLKNIAPAFRFKAAIDHIDFIGEFADEITDFAPALAFACAEHEKLMEYKRTLPDKRILHYVCCWPQYPNTWLKSDLAETLYLGIVTAYLGLDGFLRWSYTFWTENPLEEIRFKPGSWPAGDANLVYPGKGGKPLYTPRYKCLKNAVELYDMLMELKAKKGEAAFMKAFDYVMYEKNPGKMFDGILPAKSREDMFSVNYEDYMALTKYLLEELSEN